MKASLFSYGICAPAGNSKMIIFSKFIITSLIVGKVNKMQLKFIIYNRLTRCKKSLLISIMISASLT